MCSVNEGFNMPLFQIDQSALVQISATNFPLEKELQTLIERSLETVFSCRLVATEFPTGQ